MTKGFVQNEKVECPYCHATAAFFFPFYSRRYHRCPSCDLIFLNKSKTQGSDESYYRTHYFDDYAEDQLSGQRMQLYRHILKIVEKNHPKESLLDVGCGCGHFLKEAQDSGWRVFGVDPSAQSVAYALKLVGENVINGTIEDVPQDRRFDAIAMINVLDHLKDPFTPLQQARALMPPGGILYLRFPNGLFHAFLMRLSLRLSTKQFLNPFLIFHEYAFTPRAIRQILDDVGFADIRVFNSAITGGNFPIARLAKGLIGGMTQLIKQFSAGRLIVGPSIEVLAFNRTSMGELHP